MTSQNTTSYPSPLSATAAALCGVMGLIDIGFTGVIGSKDAPPLVVSIVVAALGLITLLALVPARRGSRTGLAAVLTARSISALLAIPAFFLDAPVWVMALEAFVIAATIAVLVMVRQASHQASGHRTAPQAGLASHHVTR